MMTSTKSEHPQRHGSQIDVWRPFIGKLRVFFPRRKLPDADLFAAFGERLNHGDPAMDVLVDWMLEQGMSKTKPLFLQALEHGIETIENAPDELRTFFDTIESRPSWVDDDLLKVGAEAYAMMGESLAFGLRDFVLMGGYLSSSINEVLALSGGLKSGVVKRLAETSQWANEVSEPGGMERFAPGFIATIRVRWVHALVRRRIACMPEWDQQQHGLPVNQTDMIVTWLGFAIAGPLAAMQLGRLVLSPKDLKGYLHLFKYAHWLMGVDPAFLSDDPVQCAWLLANNVLAQPGPTEVCRQMAQALGAHKREQNYAYLPTVLGRWEQYRQLDRSRYFLGRKSMDRLGLPRVPLPLFTLGSLPGQALGSLTRRFLLPGQREKLIRRGRAEQKQFMDELYRGHSREWAPEHTSHIAAQAT